MSTRFTTKLDEDDYGDLVLTIPYEIVEDLGWYRDTELEYDIDENGQMILRKCDSNE
tara:strand:+ start:311 stop:481 length:171 start_codon:yes stop_codon:yes gene_type:complete